MTNDLLNFEFGRIDEFAKGKIFGRYFIYTQVFLLIDIRHDPSANDKMMYDWMVYQGFTPIIIATKLDKIKRSQIQKNVKAIREGLKVKPGTVIIPFSSETKQGRD